MKIRDIITELQGVVASKPDAADADFGDLRLYGSRCTITDWGRAADPQRGVLRRETHTADRFAEPLSDQVSQTLDRPPRVSEFGRLERESRPTRYTGHEPLEVILDDPETDQESMLHIRGIEPGSRFDFTPQPDITAPELARLIALFRVCIELSAEQMERLEADPNLLRHLTKRE